MSRIVKNWKPEKVEDFPVAPHRYLYSGTILRDGSPAKDLDLCDSYGERRANMPYRDGEVIYVCDGGGYCRARILLAFWSYNSGEIREWYTVQRETKKGLWSKRWDRVYPGYIQRGYFRAAVAPELEGIVK